MKGRNKIDRRTFLGAGVALPLAAGAAGAAAGDVRERPAHETEEGNPRGPLVTRISLVQLRMGAGTSPPIERMPAFFEEAAGLGSDLVVFPEYVLGHRIIPEDNVAKAFFGLARKHRINAIVGCTERHGADQYSTSAWIVNRDGKLVGRHLKSHPAAGPPPHYWPPLPGQDIEARGVLGSDFPVFHLDFAPVGIIQCYDGYFPEAWGCTSYAGAEIILWLNGRPGMIEDAYAITAGHCYGCVVGAVITDGRNTGFTARGTIRPLPDYKDRREEMRLYPRLKQPGDACLSADINLSELRWRRKHLRYMHQRRPEMYGLLTRDVKMWQNYPEIPWDYSECADLVNKAQL